MRTDGYWRLGSTRVEKLIANDKIHLLMKLNNSIWKPKVDRIDDLLSEQPTYSEKEAFLKAKVDHFVGVQIKEFGTYYAILYFFFLKDKIEESRDNLLLK